jgi:hypothetical protein
LRTKYGTSREITTTPKQTIGGRKWESEKEGKKVDMDRGHKRTRSDYKGTISGKRGTADSGSEVEIPTRETIERESDRRPRKNKKITRFWTTEIKHNHDHTRDINAYNHSLSYISRISIKSHGNHRFNMCKFPSKWER